VPIKDIDTVTVDVKGWGTSWLKIMGKGTVLAKAKMPTSFAHNCQDWIIGELGL